MSSENRHISHSTRQLRTGGQRIRPQNASCTVVQCRLISSQCKKLPPKDKGEPQRASRDDHPFGLQTTLCLKPLWIPGLRRPPLVTPGLHKRYQSALPSACFHWTTIVKPSRVERGQKQLGRLLVSGPLTITLLELRCHHRQHLQHHCQHHRRHCQSHLPTDDSGPPTIRWTLSHHLIIASSCVVLNPQPSPS